MGSCCGGKAWPVWVILGLATASWIGFSGRLSSQSAESGPTHIRSLSIGEQAVSEKSELATLAAGCFWCVEAVYEELNGVKSVKSGYIGGEVDNPTYEQVCSGTTGHAEACQIEFDPDVVSYEQILEVFWKTHDPTTLNRQGADFGTQYRSAVFYHSEEQKELAEKYKAKLDASGAFNHPIVTEITPSSQFYVAERKHQDYFSNNPTVPYCRAVIVPKMDKFREVFADQLKKKAGK